MRKWILLFGFAVLLCPVFARAAGLPDSDPNVPYVEFLNEPSQVFGDLSVTKTVTGGGDTNKDFHFTVTLSDPSVSGTFGEMTFTNGVAEFTLKHGQTKTARQLPAELTYTVTESEANRDGYKTKQTGDTGTIPQDSTAKAEFTNHLNTAVLPYTGGTGAAKIFGLSVLAIILGGLLIRAGRKRN